MKIVRPWHISQNCYLLLYFCDRCITWNHVLSWRFTFTPYFLGWSSELGIILHCPITWFTLHRSFGAKNEIITSSARTCFLIHHVAYCLEIRVNLLKIDSLQNSLLEREFVFQRASELSKDIVEQEPRSKVYHTRKL